MKRSRSSWIASLFIALLLGLPALLLSGCLPRSVGSVAGVYARSYEGVSETLTLWEDGTFRQDLQYPDGSKWPVDSLWTLKGSMVTLQYYYEGYSIEKNGATYPPTKVAGCYLEVGIDQLYCEAEPSFVRIGRRQAAARNTQEE